MENNLVNTNSANDGIVVTINDGIRYILSSMGVPEQWLIITKFILMLIILIAFVYLLQKITKWFIRFVLERVYKITHLRFFHYAIDNKLPHYLALVIPYSFVRGAVPVLFYHYDWLIGPMINLTDIYMVFMVIWSLVSLIKSLFNLLQERPSFKDKPMKSYVQIIQIVMYIFGIVIIYCLLTGKSPTIFFATMAGASAVLMLMFKDTIMGFVSSIQLTSNDMVKLDDWITMNKYGADGNVEEVNLTTVKVRNFDKTITTIPTYALIADSFQNWRGMEESGGRRIKRAIFIQQNSIRFLTADELEQYKKMEGLSGYIDEKIGAYKEHKDKTLDEVAPNGSHILTNNDLFIKYAIYYLRNHPQINQSMTLLVRQLAPTTQGLPIEIYTFTSTTAWAEYETIMSEVMSHFIAAVKEFDLVLFESIAGTDSYTVHLPK